MPVQSAFPLGLMMAGLTLVGVSRTAVRWVCGDAAPGEEVILREFHEGEPLSHQQLGQFIGRTKINPLKDKYFWHTPTFGYHHISKFSEVKSGEGKSLWFQ
mmetsp:Transcript_24261/g.34228  ORF Transcript_24261/g.34228 Transcript_24261/m.34228 type:complete len:101 (-) Transcript_24261:125-427(-)|eukprot:CAMPEP_0175097454 /NCGR_PEP_ID=MMETSP0086_2-20121207/5295_1 /TAXON_ID=136419 /ORGANISM="Unknown Unknown, Strain D1" /LENGTH=100 /DNA_ID=CAMNT_0016370965 /DNA_START=22 /DNA_END=324 /DNA_ORIENTATION=-